jgi:sigma-54-specific transcriptional regulator
MDLLAHNFSAEFARSANMAKGVETEAESEALIAFRDAQRLSLLVRATAFVFSDPKSRALHELIEKIAPSEATVLITGETGTGKELVARHVHALSNRREANFVAINCGAFSETLIESELFGYERGAFTGALQGKPGWFEAANGGTLFLDEIGDLPMPMQVKLLRVLQEREVVRLGSRNPIPINVRLIAATNVDLAEAVRAGRFREDLYFRLQVISLPLQPLRERPGDIQPLTKHFLQSYTKRLQLQGEVALTADAEQALLSYPWPGNIRELENVIHRALLVCQNSVVEARDLALPGWLGEPLPKSALHQLQATTDAQADEHIADSLEHHAETELARFKVAWQALLDSGEAIHFESLQNDLVLAAWEHTQRNQVRAAKNLNISRNILRTYLKKCGVLS